VLPLTLPAREGFLLKGGVVVSSQAVLESKQKVVAEISDKLQRAASAVLTDYRGLNVAEATKLRKELREAGVEYRVLKNTLTKLAAEKVGYKELLKDLVGPTAIAFSYDDPVAPSLPRSTKSWNLSPEWWKVRLLMLLASPP
jgi:hypothetical protein